MTTRKLLTVASDKPVGAVVIDGTGKIHLDGAAEEVFAQLRARTADDTRFITDLMTDGWSNGYLYLGPPT